MIKLSLKQNMKFIMYNYCESTLYLKKRNQFIYLLSIYYNLIDFFLNFINLFIKQKKMYLLLQTKLTKRSFR